MAEKEKLYFNSLSCTDSSKRRLIPLSCTYIIDEAAAGAG